ncbi:MAG TPA: linear amide C-N hydrolase [Nostocaceae cyanobacterium]|nr:linear amide C-N hydrolase [Nostocaceae cyanobacterium]
MCTRVLYVDQSKPPEERPEDRPDCNVITGRNMDWAQTTYSDFWAFPVGMKRVGLVCDKEELMKPDHLPFNPFEWTSKYGSVIVSAYDASTTDGMNTEGLMANLLFLSVSEYPKSQGLDEKLLSAGAWPQYLLDTCATVQEAVDTMRSLKDKKIRIKTSKVPGRDSDAGLHVCVSDKTGDSAIFEYRNGELDIHHGREYTVMTNNPFYDQQLAMNEYWQYKNSQYGDGGILTLPGTNLPEDRFARASGYLSKVSHNNFGNPRRATATTLSIVRNASVPLGLTNEKNPFISSTIWSTVADHRNLIYYFSNVLSPSLCWVEIKKLNLEEGSGVRKIPLEENFKLGGDVTDKFEPAEPFEFTCEPKLS